MRLLELGLAAVPHELGVGAREHNEPVAPARIPQPTAAQQHLVIVERVRLAVAPPQRALELVEQLIRHLALQRKVQLGHLAVDGARVGGDRLEQLGHLRQGLPHLCKN